MLNNNGGMENGYVVLPIEKYMEMVNTVKEAEIATDKLIRLYVGYNKQVEVKLDAEQIYTVAKKRYETSSFNTPERELIAPETFGAWTSDLTKAVPTEDIEE